MTTRSILSTNPCLNATRLLLPVLGLCFNLAVYAQHARSERDEPTAAVPRLLRISNTFRPVDGSQAAPVESVTVSIYKDERDVTPLWQETQNVGIESEGHYSALIGSTLPDGMPADLFSTGDPRWMGIRFNRPGETEQPRVRLASVPYALKASDSDTLGGHPASDYLLNPNAGAGAAAASSGNFVAASGTATAGGASKSPAPHTITGSMNYLPYFIDNSNDLGNSALYQSGGNIGLGTTSPATPFHVVTGGAGNVFLMRMQNTNPGGSANFQVYNDVGNRAQVGIYGSGWGPVGSIGVGEAYIYTSAPGLDFSAGAAGSSIKFMAGGVTEQARLDSNGNLGVGTTSPAFKVDVAGTVNANNPAASGPANGVQGTSNSPNAAGVSGFNSTTAGGFPIGVIGSVNGTSGAGVYGSATQAGAPGVSGNNSATSGNAIGVAGSSASSNGSGVNGSNSATTGYPVGVEGSVNGPVGAGINGNAVQAGAVGVSGSNSATSGNAIGVAGSSASPNGSGVNGSNSATTGFPVGVQGNVNGTVGSGVAGNAQQAGAVGVNGYNSATSGFAVGVNGATASNGGAGVNGYNSATSGYAIGVQGGNASNSGVGVQGNGNGTGGYAVVGFHSGTSGGGVGTQGVSASPTGIGILGQSMQCGSSSCSNVNGTAGQLTGATTGTLLRGLSGPAGNNVGGNTQVFYIDGLGNANFSGTVTSAGGASTTINTVGGAALTGTNNATSGFSLGVKGATSSTSGVGVYGINMANSGFAIGVQGSTNSPNGGGVLGTTNQSSGWGVQGSSNATTGGGVGVFAESASPNGSALLAQSQTCGPSGCNIVAGTAALFETATAGVLLRGISGAAGASNGTGAEVFRVDGLGNGTFTTVNATTAAADNAAVSGNSTATSGSAVGVYGSIASTGGGVSAGVFGTTNQSGTVDLPVSGVIGYNGATFNSAMGANNYAIGVVGASANTSGAGIVGASMSCPSGAGCSLAAGTAAQLEAATTGTLLKGMSAASGGAPGAATQVFVIDGGGNATFNTVTAKSGDIYVSNPGSGIILKSPDGTKCARISIDNTGALAMSSVTCM